MSISRFDPLKHPRDSKGRFADTPGFDPTALKQTFKGVKAGPVNVNARASLRSLTVSASKSVPISKSLRLHGAALVRLERVSAQRSYLERLTNKVLLKISNRLPTQKLQDMAADIILKRQTSFAGVNVGTNRPRGRQVSARKTFKQGKGITSGTTVRSPNRKPRTRSIANKATGAKKHTSGRKVR